MGKLFARVVPKQLQIIAESIYPESKCVFRSNRSNVDMVFSLRQEKCREQQQPLHMAFLDLTKAFDFVDRNGTFQVLLILGC